MAGPGGEHRGAAPRLQDPRLPARTGAQAGRTLPPHPLVQVVVSVLV